MPWTRWPRREQNTERRFVDALLNGIKRFLTVLGCWWKRRTAPPGPGQDETYTDQW